MRRVSFAMLALILLAAHDGPPPVNNTKALAVPYRLAPTQHVVVRAKINGRGPYNFVLDTGAPLLIFSKKLEGPLGIKADDSGWTTLDKFEIEGGVVLEKQQARVEDLFQLEGMNGLGAAGIELHGLIGYPVLARYRIEYDFSKPKLQWTKLDFVPDEIPRGGKSMVPAGLNALGGIMKTVGRFLGMDQFQKPTYRAFLGVTVAEKDGHLVVKSVLPDSPTGRALPAIKVGQVVTHLGTISTPSASAFRSAQGKLKAGEATTLQTSDKGQTTIHNLAPSEGF